MFSPLLIHLLLWCIGAWLLGLALDRILTLRTAHVAWLVMGLSLTAYLSGLLLWPFLVPGQGNALLARWINRLGEAWAGKALLLGLAILILWGSFRIMRVWAERRKMHRMLLDPGAMAEAGAAWEEEESFRRAVEAQFAETLQRHVRVRYGARIIMPTTLGAWPPTILLPHWLIRHPELHAAAKVLLNREREHIRLGQAKWAELLTWIAAALPPLSAMKTALNRCMAARAEASLLAHSSPEAGARYKDAASRIRAANPDSPAPVAQERQQAPAYGLLWGAMFVVVAVLLAWPTRWTRPVNWMDAGRILSLAEPAGYRVAIRSPGLELRALPGIGGDFPDGLLVDTRRVKEGEPTLLSLRFPVPPIDRPILSVRLHFRVKGRYDAPPRLRIEALRWFTLPGVGIGSEVMDQDMVDFNEKEGWAEVSACLPPEARKDPRSEVSVWFTVPSGTRLEITQVGSKAEPGFPRPQAENIARQAQWDAFLDRYADLPAFNTAWQKLSDEE